MLGDTLIHPHHVSRDRANQTIGPSDSRLLCMVRANRTMNLSAASCRSCQVMAKLRLIRRLKRLCLTSSSKSWRLPVAGTAGAARTFPLALTCRHHHQLNIIKHAKVIIPTPLPRHQNHHLSTLEAISSRKTWAANPNPRSTRTTAPSATTTPPLPKKQRSSHSSITRARPPSSRGQERGSAWWSRKR